MLLAASVAGCGSGAEPASRTGKPLVVATTTQIADLAREVGGSDVTVYGILRPNVDAHDAEPSPADLDAIARADVILQNGLGLEPWLPAAIEASGTRTRATDTSRGAHLIPIDSGEGAHSDTAGGDRDHRWNPHLWLDPTNAAVMVRNIATAIVAAAPEHKARILTRRDAYLAELTELDGWIKDRLADLRSRTLVTDHDAFPYYFARYDLTSVGTVIPSFDTSAEVSAADLNDLARTIRDEDVAAIFTEQSLSPKAAEMLGRRTGATVVSGDDGLYADSLGPAGSDGDTYLKMMRHNTRTFAEHLS